MNKVFLYVFVFLFIYYGLSAIINIGESNKGVPIIVSQSKAVGYIVTKNKKIFNNCQKTHIDCYKEKFEYTGTLDLKHSFKMKNLYVQEFNIGDKVELVIKYYNNGEAEYHLDLEKYINN